MLLKTIGPVVFNYFKACLSVTETIEVILFSLTESSFVFIQFRWDSIMAENNSPTQWKDKITINMLIA